MVFEYLTVLISVVVGLSLTHFLTHLVRIVNLRDEVVISWVQLTWAATLVFWTVSFWWFTFVFTEVHSWSFALFLFVLGYAVFLYVLLALLFPADDVPGKDYRAQFMKNRRWFYGVFLAFLCYDVADFAIKLGENVSIVDAAPYALWIGYLLAMTVIALFTERLLFHRVFAGTALASLFVLSYFTLAPLAEA